MLKSSLVFMMPKKPVILSVNRGVYLVFIFEKALEKELIF